MHDKCRIDYIRKSSVSDQYEDMSENIGRFEAVKREIQESVIEKDRAISMKVIHKL